MSAFLRDFDLYFCKLFDGARHDSGDPFAWGERLLEHYRKNRVDPLTKTLIFSDASPCRAPSSCTSSSAAAASWPLALAPT
jgi:nicotinic acid phosphoribosyltransferase